VKLNSQNLDQALAFLSQRLADAEVEPQELVICGGSGLIALGLVNRSTEDVDILGRLDAGRQIVDPRPLSSATLKAADEVAVELGLPKGWLNAGPADQIHAGLPQGFLGRMVTKPYGAALTAHFASRLDQIHLKFFAALDQGPGRHVDDLLTLQPTPAEMEAAARWVLSQDASAQFPQQVRDGLKALGYEKVADKI
jgi:hypothetical protein